MKQKLVLLAILILILSALLSFYSFLYPSTHGKRLYASQINAGINLYTQTEIESIDMADYFLLASINNATGAIPPQKLNFLRSRYKDDPYKRLINKYDLDTKISFSRQKNHKDDFDYYKVRNISSTSLGWDGILLKALYCDKKGYTEEDFKILSTLRKNDGNYEDTHYLLALIILKENRCYEENILNEKIKKTAMVIINKQNQKQPFSDIFAERIVVLYWAGYGKEVKKEWVESIAKIFDKKYGWNEKNKNHFNAHTTGLSLLSLIYFSEGKNLQNFY